MSFVAGFEKTAGKTPSKWFKRPSWLRWPGASKGAGMATGGVVRGGAAAARGTKKFVTEASKSVTDFAKKQTKDFKEGYKSTRGKATEEPEDKRSFIRRHPLIAGGIMLAGAKSMGLIGSDGERQQRQPDPYVTYG